MRRLAVPLLSTLAAISMTASFAINAAAEDTSFRPGLDVVECPTLLSSTAFYEGSIRRILERDGISRAKLRDAKKLTGAEGALLYTTKLGQKFILKANSPHEVLTAIADRVLGLHLAAQVESVSTPTVAAPNSAKRISLS